MIIDFEWEQDKKDKKVCYVYIGMSHLWHDSENVDSIEFREQTEKRVVDYWGRLEKAVGRPLKMVSDNAFDDIYYNEKEMTYILAVKLKKCGIFYNRKNYRESRENSIRAIGQLIQYFWQYKLYEEKEKRDIEILQQAREKQERLETERAINELYVKALRNEVKGQSEK